jgi:hypothetical protein
MEILTHIDIEIIKENSKSNPVFQYYGLRKLVSPQMNWKEVVAVSDKGLILIKGNCDTGYQHINERHNFWSIKPYSNGKEFQAQSKFPENIAPIEFIKIADSIYSLENFIVKNEHNGADKFEKYVGDYSFDGENFEKVNLILYKTTKIIHSLYPQNKRYNKNKNKTKYPYTRGQVKVTTDKFFRITEIFVPFLDINLHQKYGLVIDQTKGGDVEEWNILQFDNNGKYEGHLLFGIKPKSKFRGDTSARITFQHCDLKIIEDFLIEMDKNNEIK